MSQVDKINNKFNKAMEALEVEEELYWNHLSKEDQLKCFCAVARRIYKGEIEDKGTYRHVLYNVFHFGPDAYVSAQLAGYSAIHNAIFDSEHEDKILESFAKHLGHNNPEKAVKEFYEGAYNAML